MAEVLGSLCHKGFEISGDHTFQTLYTALTLPPQEFDPGLLWFYFPLRGKLLPKSPPPSNPPPHPPACQCWFRELERAEPEMDWWNIDEKLSVWFVAWHQRHLLHWCSRGREEGRWEGRDGDSKDTKMRTDICRCNIQSRTQTMTGAWQSDNITLQHGRKSLWNCFCNHVRKILVILSQ